jgi:hypothetical protein
MSYRLGVGALLFVAGFGCHERALTESTGEAVTVAQTQTPEWLRCWVAPGATNVVTCRHSRPSNRDDEALWPTSVALELVRGTQTLGRARFDAGNSGADVPVFVLDADPPPILRARFEMPKQEPRVGNVAVLVYESSGVSASALPPERPLRLERPYQVWSVRLAPLAQASYAVSLAPFVVDVAPYRTDDAAGAESVLRISGGGARVDEREVAFVTVAPKASDTLDATLSVADDQARTTDVNTSLSGPGSYEASASGLFKIE